jgi:histone arginine demethylase JMJD6
MQVYGSKEYLLFPPDQGKFLYPRPGVERNKSSIPDIERTDPTRFPLFSQARAARAIVKAGEMLFVPSGWWHTTRILEPTITISVNTVNNTNWRPFVGDYIANKARHSSRNRVQLLSFYMNVFGIVANLVAFC